MVLLIVESPTKAKTIQLFLGAGYRVLSSYGHVRDLPKSDLGIDVENNFQPRYVIPTKARKNLNFLKKESAKADKIFLSTDPDREGEAIAWHLSQVLGQKQNSSQSHKTDFQRVIFHEITKQAVGQALKNPKNIDLNLVNSQQARRILDRLVGYELSPFLWKKISRGLSAGRVQSVAVKLIAEREKEIQAFVPQEYWTIEALLENNDKQELTAVLAKENGKAIAKTGLEDKKQTEEIVKKLKNAGYSVLSIDKKEIKKNPLPPFTTSALQQEAWQKLRLSSKLTMQLAQKLYEKGIITYHRTDSLNLSEQSLIGAKEFIEKNYGPSYWPGYFRKYKSKGRVQEAHEAIRPTNIQKLPQKNSFSDDGGFAEKLAKLYELIWRRFTACQMSAAALDSTSINIKAENNKDVFELKATGQIVRFDGFMKIYPMKLTEKELPPLEKSDILNLIKLIPLQHFTQPPARYNDATLIKKLEEEGIGRPSTYSPIISTIQERNYVLKDEEKRFCPTETGLLVNDLLSENFPSIVNTKFTAKMEEDLDEIADGTKQWTEVIASFYKPFKENLEQKYQTVAKKNIIEETEEKCPKCESPLIIRFGKFGKFIACSAFPKCRYTAPLQSNQTGITCPRCQKGKITEKRSKRGRIFYGCSSWPECDFALWDKPIDQFCQRCGSIMIEAKNKTYCSNPECSLAKKAKKQTKNKNMV